MTVISSQEFVANQEKYFDMALKDNLIIQKGENRLIMQNFTSYEEPDMIFESDEDFYKSISMEELRSSAHEHIHKLFAKK